MFFEWVGHLSFPRLYKSPAEVLMGFDIDACAVGYDGKNAYALERACRAITRGYNLVDMSRRSLTYESRLYKYSKRGFAVAIPGFDRYAPPPLSVRSKSERIFFFLKKKTTCGIC